MNRPLLITCIGLSLCLLVCGAGSLRPGRPQDCDTMKQTISIIPEPLRTEQQPGSFPITAETVLSYRDTGAVRSAASLQEYLGRYYGLVLPEGRIGPRRYGIRLDLQEQGERPQGAYELEVTPVSVTVTGYGEEGLFYGVQSLLQLLPPQAAPGEETIGIPCVKIADAPRFSYRGMHLDVVRHMFPVDYVKRYIDYLARHKMNYFHWHLTDDQGWRMESRSHPRLNERGAYRDGTIIGLFPGTGMDSTRYGGYYTVEELKEVVRYAADRYITVVPEIDVPGHCMAVLAAYPEFGTEPDKPVKPAVTWGIFNRQNNVLAPGEAMFRFLEDVYNELMDVFPGPYIHIGADECAHKWWKESEATQRFMAEHGLKDTKALQHYFAQRISDVVTARGRTVVGWDEMVDNGLVEGAVVMSWRNEKGAYRAMEQGHRAIMAPAAYSYLNMKQKEKEDTLCHVSRVVSLEKIYRFEPLPDTVSVADPSLLLGGQGCMWTEYFPHRERLEYGLFPRLSAIAEVYWSDRNVRDWNRFLNKMPDQFARYDLWGANSCRWILEQTPPDTSCPEK